MDVVQFFKELEVTGGLLKEIVKEINKRRRSRRRQEKGVQSSERRIESHVIECSKEDELLENWKRRNE